ALEVRYHERKAFLESLKNMAERYEGYGNSIRKVMEYKKENKGIFGVVADLIKVSAEYETAIETALGGNIQNIVTKDEATAKKMIEILKESKSGRATFLPLTSIVTREVKEKDALNAPGVIGQADELVEVTDKQFKAVSNTLLGNYIVVDNIDNALNLAKKYHYTLRIVTLTGEALNPGGSISGGAFKRSGNLLGRSREIDEIQAELKGILKEIDGVLIKVEEIKDEKNKCTDDLHALEDEIKEKELSRNTVTLNLKGFKDRKEELFGGLEGIKRESGQIDENIKDITQSRDKVKKELDTSVERENEIGALVDELNRNRAVKAEEADKVNSILIEADRNNAALLSEQRFTNENLEKLKESVVHFNEELESLAQSVESNENEILNKNDEIVSLKKRIEEESPDDDKKLTELNKVIADRDALNESQKDIFTERDSLAERKASNEKELIRLNAQREKIDSYFDSLRDYMWNEYELTLSGAGEFKTETDMELTDIKRRIATLKGDIKALGNVNVNSIEQYGEVMERFTFMDGQRKDIIEAEEDLKRAIAELDDEMRRQFTEEFAKIAEQFDVVFRELFGGGHGKIELTDSDDVLEAGIRITAEPPGKKLQNMMQLSGGEKSLSAIALLFGIQRLKPSPFCLLDEIEAALDEANVDRFANYLSQLSGKTQFIVITHRRGTMTKADRLYGITMQEKGVSTEVNVDLDSEDYE
nr:chromosome segregation protein SMC [Lachnospiraceae bacterium]